MDLLFDMRIQCKYKNNLKFVILSKFHMLEMSTNVGFCLILNILIFKIKIFNSF